MPYIGVCRICQGGPTFFEFRRVACRKANMARGFAGMLPQEKKNCVIKMFAQQTFLEDM